MNFKEWTKYSAQELVDIYESEDWEAFCETQFAFNKIPFLPPHPGQKPERIKTEADLTYWSVGGIKFKSENDAAKVYQLISSMEVVDTSYKASDVYTLKPLESGNWSYPSLEAHKAFSDKAYLDIKDDLKSYDKRKEEWDEHKDAYDEVKKLQDELLIEIKETIHKQQDLNTKIAHMNSCYNKYLEMSGNIQGIAKTFLADAYPEYTELFPEFFEFDVPEVPED